LHVARARRHLDTELREHVVEGLQGERGLGSLVTRAVEPHHQAVADQLVGTHAGNAGDVLEALGMYAERGGQQDSRGNQLLDVEHDHPNLERPKRADEEAVQPTGLAGIGKRAGARIGDARIGDPGRRHGVVGGDVVGAYHAGNTHQLVAGVEGHPLLAAYRDDAVGQHVGHGDGDRTGQGIALGRLAVALGGAVAAVAGAEA
uniref:PpsA n=1 Tax=Steinernema glaseri TaxID=37863 RepID=A0A1I8APU4_9BILA